MPLFTPRPDDQAPIPLDDSPGQLIRAIDGVMLEQPLPVRLIAVDDVTIPCPAGVDHLLDAFYVELLGMKRVTNAGPSLALVIEFRADNVSLRLAVEDRPVEHDALRPMMVEVDDRGRLIKEVIDRRMPFEMIKSLIAGEDHLLLIDPAGNYVGVLQHRRF